MEVNIKKLVSNFKLQIDNQLTLISLICLGFFKRGIFLCFSKEKLKNNYSK